MANVRPITVNLAESGDAAMRECVDQTNQSEERIVNRALHLYWLVLGINARKGTIYVQDSAGGDIRRTAWGD